jgi:hypothetical protein
LPASASAGAGSIAHWLVFIRTPSAATGYCAHNASILAGYLAHESLVASELWAERFMINLA